MAILKPNALGDLAGRLGDLVIAKHRNGLCVVRKRPIRTAPATPGEKKNQSKLRLAVAWAKAVWADQPELKAQYAAAGKLQDRRAFDLAKADFLRPPAIDDMDLSRFTGKKGEQIRIRAIDDFEVAEVRVKIQGLDGSILEEGAAGLDGSQWLYTATVDAPSGKTVVIEAKATDHPGHTAVRKVDHACGPRATA